MSASVNSNSDIPDPHPKSESGGDESGKPSEDAVSEKPSVSVRSEKPSEDAVSEKPSEDAVSEKPSVSVRSEKPSEDAVSEKPSEDAVSEKPSEDAVSEKPSEDAVSEKPSKDAVSEKPSESNRGEKKPVQTLKLMPEEDEEEEKKSAESSSPSLASDEVRDILAGSTFHRGSDEDLALRRELEAAGGEFRLLEPKDSTKSRRKSKEKEEEHAHVVLQAPAEEEKVEKDEEKREKRASRARFSVEEEAPSTYMGGDFKMLTDPYATTVSFSFESLVSASPSETLTEVMGEQEPKIDRQMYYQMHAFYTSQELPEKLKNNYMHRKMADYYTRRRMEHVLRESFMSGGDADGKYYEELVQLSELNAASTAETKEIRREIDELEKMHATKLAECTQLLELLQHMEGSHGKSLADEKGNMDKIVDRLLHRQRVQLNALIKLRLEFLRMKTYHAERVDDLNALDHLGPGYHIMDYYQLKADNRNLRDKLEERDNELIKIRKLVQNKMQILAHNREKSTAIDVDIRTEMENLEASLIDFDEARENVFMMKSERDECRVACNKLREESGLLSLPKMLIDMEKAIKEIDDIQNRVQHYTADYVLASRQLIAVRKHMGTIIENREAEHEQSRMKNVTNKLMRGATPPGQEGGEAFLLFKFNFQTKSLHKP